MEFDSLLKLMVHKNASDLFITAGIPPSMKISGKIGPVAKGSLTPDQAKQICYGIMNTEQRAEFEARRESNFALSRSGIGRFRVNVFQQRNQVGMVLRKIETKIPTFDDLDLPDVLRELTMTKRGIVLFVGGTGSGKSTSLAAMVDHRNTQSTGHIITIEDPIEYIHQHKGCIVTQREVGIDTDTFEDALINTLRQAPDVILIGEIRHRETMEHAIAFAETGHLCLATLHANNANQAMDRVINFFPEDRRPQLLMDLSLNMKAVIAQRLIPKKDGIGRRAAVEVMINTPLMADLIHKGEVHQMKELMKKSGEQGMQTFDQALYNLYMEGSISFEDATRNADSPNEVRIMAKLGAAESSEDLTKGLEGLTLEETTDEDGPGGLIR
ncbi:PilT/PilU family type 4a pilus ATPase [Thiohalomonas denitrificans]|uniref:Twitching motility protein PilU n=1 Tax=Thiohalomonas denitrificans TaxID=415747 RepID=A0A1G5QJ55_9GAMM|nr:PilT/PilU family type 4a pilus ATPase [Thiohalomonas denitrificans]SCZ61895.1 twitching motility protein PilU [Thiohalomonas denitrificans]